MRLSQKDKKLSIKKICIVFTCTVPNYKTAIPAILRHLPVHIISLVRVWILNTRKTFFSKNTGKTNACNDVARKLLRGEVANMIAFRNIISTQGWTERHIFCICQSFCYHYFCCCCFVNIHLHERENNYGFKPHHSLWKTEVTRSILKMYQQ